MVGNTDFLKPLVQQIVQDVLESEMDDLLQATKHERVQTGSNGQTGASLGSNGGQTGASLGKQSNGGVPR